MKVTIQLLLSDWDSHKENEMRYHGRQAGWSISVARPDAENITVASAGNYHTTMANAEKVLENNRQA
jgi:hypothetical protein